MNNNNNESAPTLRESAMCRIASSSRDVPLSKWSIPSLIVLRALEMDDTIPNSAVISLFYPLTHRQAAPILSIRAYAIDGPIDEMSVADRVAALVACGAVVEGWAPDLGGTGCTGWPRLRFPMDLDNAEVRSLARDIRSAAQDELDRRKRVEQSRGVMARVEGGC